MLGVLLLAAVVVSATDVAPVAGGNALTLPSQRHMVRLAPQDASPVLLLAVQQQGVQGRGLGFFRSDDEGASWRYEAPIQDDPSHPDRADIAVVGNDFYLVYSIETPAGNAIAGSTRHDVVLQRWSYRGGGDWEPSSSVVVFDSSSDSTAWYRATLAIDSTGRIWVNAFRLEADGTSSVWVASSGDGGATFASQRLGGGLAARGGGRIEAVGGKVVVLFDEHDVATPARLFIRSDGASLSSWSGPSNAFSEGIYHGAAFSSVVRNGLLHLAYKDENEVLRYRVFDGQSFGPSTTIDSRSHWAMQPAIAAVDDELYLFWNHQLTETNFELRVRRMSDGAVTVLDTRATWKGYLATPATLSGDAAQVVCAFGDTPTPNDSGWVRSVRIARQPTSGPPPDDEEPPPPPPPPPAPVDAGTPNAGTLLFSDSFTRTSSSGLGAGWTIDSGLWMTRNFAQSDLDGEDRARASNATCADCRVEARMVGFGVPLTGLFARATSPTERYELVLTGNGTLELHRFRGGSSTVLARAASGVPALNDWATFSLVVTGNSPVQLSAWVNGALKLSGTDSSSSRIVGAGQAGLHTTHSGVLFDDFKLYTADATQPSVDGGSATPDAGTAVPDAGTKPVADAGTAFDAGTVTPPPASDGGSGTVSQVSFFDDFNRANGALSGNWDAAKGLWLLRNNAAQSDLDGADLALARGVTCANCTVQSRIVGFGVPETSLALRVQSAPSYDRYELTLNGSGALVIRRWRNGTATTLGSAASGISDLTNWASVSLAANGTATNVTLTAAVGGAVRLSVTDTSSAAIRAEGRAGLSTTRAGVAFDDFRLSGTSSGSGDAGTPSSADAGTTSPPAIDAGTPASSGELSLEVTYTNSAYRVLAVHPGGTILGLSLSDNGSRLYASTDGGRTFAPRYALSSGGFTVITALSNGTLLATVRDSSGWALWRSTDTGASFAKVLSLGQFQTLTPNSIQVLNGTVFLLEYQTFTGADTPIRLWASANDGQSWTTRFTFTGHRHGHGLRADPSHGELWAFFGDTTPQSGVFRSADNGFSWVKMVGDQQGDVVDAVVTPNGLLFGQDISYLPDLPHVATVSRDGAYKELFKLTGPAYSTFAIPGGGYLVGAAREPDGDIYGPGEVRATVAVSADGTAWKNVLSFERLSSTENALANVYYALPSGELVLQLENVRGFGPGGFGFQLLRVRR